MTSARPPAIGLVAMMAVTTACGRLGFDGTSGGGDGGARDGSVVVGDGTIPAGTNIAFVTSTKQPPSSLNGRAGADALCNARAAAGRLPGTYVAWLSTSTANAIDQLSGSRGWVRADGAPFVDAPADLAAGTIFYPLLLDEAGQPSSAGFPVATGTNAQGVLPGANLDCNGYTSDNGMQLTQGSVGDTAPGWTDQGVPTGCTTAAPIYCFGVGNTSAVRPPPITTRRAFVSPPSAVGEPAMGLAAADATCQTAAVGAGLGGTYHALLATTGASAASRFSVAGTNWVRTDGIPIAASPTDLLNGNWQAALDVLADGTHAPSGGAWSGSTTPTTAGAANATCSGWTKATSGFFGDYGLYNTIYGVFFTIGSPIGCDVSLSYYCLEL